MAHPVGQAEVGTVGVRAPPSSIMLLTLLWGQILPTTSNFHQHLDPLDHHINLSVFLMSSSVLLSRWWWILVTLAPTWITT